MIHREVAIAGGGIGGLATALGLLQAGHQVRVFEQSTNPSETGAGLSIAPNAAAVLKALGLREALAEISDLPVMGHIHNGHTGEELATTPFGETVREHFGDYYFQTPRTALYELLSTSIQQLDPGCIRTGHRLVSFDEQDKGVLLNFTNGSNARADLLVGADGLRSATRAQMTGEQTARFTRYIAWRALIPMDRLSDAYARPHSNVWIGPERNFVFYPLSRGRQLNCVMFAGDSTWTDESWRTRATVDEIRAAYDGFHPTVQTVIDALPEDACYKWALFDREPISRWHSDSVALLGDAAHPMLPFLGQGASMALEDAAVLIHAVNHCQEIQSGLAAYAKARIDRANWVLLESRAAGARFASPNPSASLFENDQAQQTMKLFGWQPPALR